MSKVLAVLRREVRHTVMTKAFIIAVVGVPILMAGALAIAVVMMATHREPPLAGTVLVVDADGTVTEGVAARFAGLADRRPLAEQQERMAEAMAGAETAEERAAAAIGAGMEASREGGMGGMGGLGRGEVRVAVERAEGDPEADVPEPLKRAVGRGEVLAVAVVPPAILEPPRPLRANGDDAAGSAASGAAGEPAAAGSDEPEPEPTPRWRLFAGEDLDADHVSIIERAIGDAIVDARAARAGVDPEATRALLARPRPATDRVGADGASRRESAELREVRSSIIPMIFMMLLWVSTFSAGTQLLHSTIEEKSNRVMEVLLSAVSPFQLLVGKILGQGLVGLIMVGVYSALGIAALVALSSTGLISAMQLVAFFVFFLMAYFMVATLMAAVGSAVSDLRDANSLLTPVMILLMIPLMLWMPITQAPNGTVATVMSFVPPAIPFVMILRVAAEEAVPLWQLGGAVAWGGLCTLGMMWAASRIFRVGVLMTGKPPSPLELIRWIRYA